MARFGWWNWYRHLPLITLDTVAGTPPNKLYNDYITHSTYDDFWKDNQHTGQTPQYSDSRVSDGWMVR